MYTTAQSIKMIADVTTELWELWRTGIWEKDKNCYIDDLGNTGWKQ